MVSVAAAVPLALLQLCAVALKPLFFDRIGLWLGPRGAAAIGYLSDPGSRELLGWWAVPRWFRAATAARSLVRTLPC